ncbi:MAG: transcriptional repressor [Candidatus Woesearchaeota archaeon]|jgi:Fe2+ or Zn2+ uptake regulation protein
MIINKEKHKKQNQQKIFLHSDTRNTYQRTKILEYLQSVCTHPTAEQVYTTIKTQIPTITLATVYRNLNILAEQRKILRLEINKEFRYDADISMHQHCICNTCNTIIDLFDKEISLYALKKIKDSFSAQSVVVIFSGQCKKCWGDKK